MSVKAPATFPDEPGDGHGLMSYDEAAERLRISSRTLRRAVAAGRAPHRRVGKLVRFTADDVAEILAAWRVAPRPRGSGPRTDRGRKRP